MVHNSYYFLLLASFALLAFFLWYLIADREGTRRKVGLALILTLTAICLWSLFVPVSDKPKAPDAWPINIKPGIDLRGGNQFTLELSGNPTKAALDQAVEQIRKRVDSGGVSEPLIQPLGDNRVIVQIPGVSAADKDAYRQKLQQVAKLEFKLVHPKNAQLLAAIEAGQATVPFDYEIAELVDHDKKGAEIRERILIRKIASMSGKYVDKAFRSVDNIGRPTVAIEFDKDGREIFAKLTEANVGNRMAVVLDGVVQSAPNINEPITQGNCVISGGNMSDVEAENLASVLENPLENPVSIVDERGVDPSLGKASIADGFRAGMIGSAVVILFMIFYYRLAGVIAVFSLLLNMIILLGLLAQFGFTLTLPGVAGIILTIGVAVDANVLIYERMSEELRSGRPLFVAINAGFSKAFSSIMDANVTTLIAAVIMFWQGSGAIQGFAVTLCLGTISSVFAALIITRNCFDWLLVFKKIEGLTMLHAFKNANFNFMKMRTAAIGLSLLIAAAGIVSWIYRGDAVYGVDFSGGDLLTLKYEKRIPDDHIRDVVGQEAFVQYQDSITNHENILSIRTPYGRAEEAQEALMKAFPDAGFSSLGADKVQAVIGSEFKQQAFMAILLGMVGIFFYIMLRFETAFAVGAIVALLHDVVIALGIFSLLGRQLSLPVVGAILTVAGYSINDTIVIFDRIREGLREGHGQKNNLPQLFNACLNATLSRTLLTSGTTLTTVAALFFFGGVAINDFALVLLIGIMAGTYSSIFIACPVVLMMGKGEIVRRKKPAIAEASAAP